VSTVIQFRAIDWGMETCELQLVLPARAHVQTSTRPFTLTLFRLKATSTSLPLSARTLTYANRPARISKVAAIEVHPASWYTQAGESTSEPGSTTNLAEDIRWHRNFVCASDELLTFEIGCVPAPGEGQDRGCFAEWWQNRDDPMFSERAVKEVEPVPAFFITQHATK